MLKPEFAPSQLATSLLHQRCVKTRKPGFCGLKPDLAAQNVMDVIEKMWAKNTLAGRQSVWQRYETYLNHYRLPMNAQTASVWVESTQIQPQGRLGYAKTLMALQNRMKVDTTTLSLYCKGLVADGASVPQKQAIPWTLMDVDLVCAGLPPHETAAIQLCWKTVSRWDEIMRLRHYNFVKIAEDEIIIDWSNQSKSFRHDPFRASKYVVVVGKFVKDIARNLRLNHNMSITDMTTSCFDTHLEKSHHAINLLSAHGIKHGAMNVLAAAAAQGKISPTLLALIAKHKQVVDLTSTTIRYIQDRAAAARMLGTQQATALL